jgi:hypothetical protein
MPNHVLTKSEYQSLFYLSVYELTIAEQIYLDFLQPTLNNNSILYNWSSYNKGAKGYIRTENTNKICSYICLTNLLINLLLIFC